MMDASDMPSPGDGESVPVLDRDYLNDMRGWVGAATLADLLAGAPLSFRPTMAELSSCWQAGDHMGLREAAHRLAGAAGSVGARRLAGLAQRCQRLPDGQCDHTLVATMEAAVDEALVALATALD